MMEPDHIYIAGPMTNIPELNFPAFHSAAACLRAKGYKVINPAEVNPDATLPWEDCMRKDITVIMQHCKAIATLPDWHKSRGARLEVQVASSLGMEVKPVELY